jgi:hypothetical protein
LSHSFAPTGDGGMTVLIAQGDHTASKSYEYQPASGWHKISDYDIGFWFRAVPYEATSLRELIEAINAIRESRNAFIVRGELDQAWHDAVARDPEYRIARRKNGKDDGYPPHLTEVPRQWIMVDVDNYPLPPGFDLAHDPAGAIALALADLLPAAFREADCFWQLSSSAGVVPGVLKAHVFFWLSEPMDNDALRRWFAHHAPLVDIAPFNAVQPHFIADPTLIGADDPLPTRTGWRDGTAQTVTLEPLPADPAPDRRKREPRNGERQASGSPLDARSIDDALARLGNGDGLAGFHRPLLAASMQYALRCQQGGARDDAAFKAKLRAAIEAAPKRDGHTAADHMEEPYLARLIDGAFALLGNEAKHADSVGQFRPPRGFGMTDNGLFFTDPAKQDAEPRWIAQPFTIMGECANGAGGDWAW